MPARRHNQRHAIRDDQRGGTHCLPQIGIPTAFHQHMRVRHHHRVPARHQVPQGGDQAVHVLRMQTARGLIQDVQGVHEAGAQGVGQVDPLRFAPGTEGVTTTSHAATTTSTTTITTAVGVAPGSEGDPATTTSIAGTAPGSQTAPDPVLPDRGPISGN